MGILSGFTEPPKPAPPGHRYRMLVIGLCLLAFMILTGISTLGEVGFILAFLFYFVAYEFAWPTPVNVILRVLALIGALFVLFDIFYTLTPADRSGPYGGVVFILGFLFHFLARRLAWPTRVTVILRVLGWICLVFSLFYIFYLSRVLYPQAPLPLE
ncbi:MAG: hypothetical protein ACYTAO_04920 [Planctomycetota bacterium]